MSDTTVIGRGTSHVHLRTSRMTHVAYSTRRREGTDRSFPFKSIASGPNLMVTMSDDSQATIRNPIWDILRRSRVSSKAGKKSCTERKTFILSTSYYILYTIYKHCRDERKFGKIIYRIKI